MLSPPPIPPHYNFFYPLYFQGLIWCYFRIFFFSPINIKIFSFYCFSCTSWLDYFFLTTFFLHIHPNSPLPSVLPLPPSIHSSEDELAKSLTSFFCVYRFCHVSQWFIYAGIWLLPYLFRIFYRKEETIGYEHYVCWLWVLLFSRGLCPPSFVLRFSLTF